MGAAPHDGLFRATFGNVEVARSHLAGLLPGRLAEGIDWSTLAVAPASFVDDALAQDHADILYTVSLEGEPALLYLVLEHQSQADPWMPLRLLHYVASVWKRWLTERPEGARWAPPVVAVVLHHSREGWRRAPELASVFSPETQALLGDLLPRFRFLLDDISDADAATLSRRASHSLATLCLLALSSSRTWDRLVAAVPYMRRAVQALPGTPEHREALARLWRYLYIALAEPVDRETVRSILHAIAGPEYAEDAMSWAEQLKRDGREEGLELGRRQGREEGREEGHDEGRLSHARALLYRFAGERAVSLSEARRQQIDACCDVQQLDAWILRAATAQSEADIF
mgnify:CR=1 FL=1